MGPQLPASQLPVPCIDLRSWAIISAISSDICF